MILIKKITKFVLKVFFENFYLFFFKTLTKNQIQVLSRVLYNYDASNMIEGFAPLIHYPIQLKDIDNIETGKDGILKYNHLASLFASNILNHGIIGLTFKMSEYINNVVSENKYKIAIDIGTFKGGSAILLSTSMGFNSKVYTIDLLDKEKRVNSLFFSKKDAENHISNPEQLDKFKKKYNLNIIQIFGDTMKINPDFIIEDEVDVVLIDGGHTKEIVENDIKKFTKKLKIGGSLFMDDCSDRGTFSNFDDYMKEIIKDIITTKKFKFIKMVDRLGHFIKINNDNL
jgi:predicted O-methyltransferase YrrM